MAQRNEHVPSMHRARSSILYTAWTPRTIGKPKERELRLQRSVFSPALFLSPTGTPGHFTFIHRPQFCQMKKKTFSSTVLGVAMNLEHCWKWHTYTKRISQLDRKPRKITWAGGVRVQHLVSHGPLGRLVWRCCYGDLPAPLS